MEVTPIGQPGNLLAQVQEGATVYDRDNEKIGTVKQVYLGGEDLSEATVSGDSVLYDVPAALRSRLAADGFVEIGTGFLSANRYASGLQVASADADHIILNVPQDELAKK